MPWSEKQSGVVRTEDTISKSKVGYKQASLLSLGTTPQSSNQVASPNLLPEKDDSNLLKLLVHNCALHNRAHNE